MQIGTVIKKARLEKKITQEELAITLGVTTQAVSRWETGVSYPDITLIPSIANYLDVTSDELLGIKLEERKKNIDNILNENQKLKEEYNLEGGLKLLKESLRKYPNDERLLSALSKCYWDLMMKTISENQYEYRQELKKQIVECCLKILEVARDVNIIEQAKILLIHTYPRMGEEGKQKALEIVKTLPCIEYSKELRLTNVLDGEEKKKQLQANMLIGLEIIYRHFGYRIDYFFDSIEEKINIFKKNIEVIKLLIGDNLYDYNIECSSITFVIAELYASIKDKENTLKYLNKSIEYATKFCEIPLEGEYDSYWLKGFKYQIGKHINFENAIRRLDGENFKFISDTKEFKEVKNQYILLNEKRTN